MRFLYLTAIVNLFYANVLAQGYTSGFIMDEDENGIPHVQVIELGENNVSYSNDMGAFLLKYF